MADKIILLVKDNPDDEKLAVRALNKNNLANGVVVTRDGVEALNYIFGHTGTALPALVLLDLKLPEIDGMEVLRRIRADERTKRLPVVILTSSKRNTIYSRTITVAPTATSENRLISYNLSKSSGRSDYIGCS